MLILVSIGARSDPIDNNKREGERGCPQGIWVVRAGWGPLKATRRDRAYNPVYFFGQVERIVQ
jgi:hypothetical protein